MAINQNCIHEEIQAMFATIQVRIFLPSRQLSTNVKTEIHRTINLFISSYGCECLSQIENRGLREYFDLRGMKWQKAGKKTA
jgi:hypothetical protein